MEGKDKILQLMQMQNLNAKTFAEEVGIQASTISNIISGRNNPSLEVIKRILERYPTLNPDWLIFDKGEMFRATPIEKKSVSPLPTQRMQQTSLFEESPTSPNNSQQENQFLDVNTAVERDTMTSIQNENSTNKYIAEIIILYSDGTFEVKK